MKKKSEPVHKPKEFSTSPFASLKGVKTEPVPLPVQPAKESPAPVSRADDADMFLRAMADVQRLHEVRRPSVKSVVPSSKPLVRRIEENEQQLFIEALQQLKLDVTFSDELSEDVPAAPRSCNRMRQLRRGTIRIDYELDLHGLTRDEAIDALEAFIGGAYRRGQQAVLVITGKGNNSPDGPVLKGAVMGWLRNQGKEMVSEALPAPNKMGGGGATVVFIRAGGSGSENNDKDAAG